MIESLLTGGGGDFSFLSSLLALFFSPLPLSSPLFIARGRNRFSLSHDLFFSSFSHSLLLFLSFFLARASLSLSLSLSREEISVARRDFFFSLILFFLSLSPSLPHFLPRLLVSLSLATKISHRYHPRFKRLGESFISHRQMSRSILSLRRQLRFFCPVVWMR